MKERILRLCKRLDKFSFEDISTIAEDVEESVLQLLLLTLVNEKRLTQHNELYFYCKNSCINQVHYRIPKIFQYYSKEMVELVIKCFCAEIPVLKVAMIIEPSKSAIGTFYSHFRKNLYKVQLNKLKKYFEQCPKIPSVRTLYNLKIYMYCYDNELFLVNKPLKTAQAEKRHLKSEMQKMNVAYYRIRRVFQNYAFTQSVAEIAYEKLWRQGKTFEELFAILKQNLNIF